MIFFLLNTGLHGASAASSGVADGFVLLSDKKHPLKILATSDKYIDAALEILSDYLVRGAGAQPEIIRESEAAEITDAAILILDGSADNHLANKYACAKPETNREDAFHLLGKKNRIIISGKTGSGVKYGLYKLMWLSKCENNQVFVPDHIDLIQNPFIKNRVLHQSVRARTIKDAVLREKTCWEFWSRDKKIDLVKFYDFIGFNGIMKGAAGARSNSMPAYQKKLGMKYFCYAWLQVFPASNVGKTAGGANTLESRQMGAGSGGQWYACFHNDRDRKAILKRFDLLAKAGAKDADYLCTHCADPGGCRFGCDKCDYNTPMRLHMLLVKRFKAINPDIKSAFSIWGLGWENQVQWKGYENPEQIIRSEILPEDVIIATGRQVKSYADHSKMEYNAEIIDEIVKSGRKAAVWGWYFTDNEVKPSLHVHVHSLERYFKEIPADHRDKLEYHSAEVNYYALPNMAVHYVCAQLMINPKASADELMLDFCSKVYGRENAEAVKRAFDVIEEIRCPTDRAFTWHYRTVGSENPKRDLEKIETALKNLEEVEVNENNVLPFPLLSSRKEMLRELLTHLRVLKSVCVWRVHMSGLKKCKSPEDAVRRYNKIAKPDLSPIGELAFPEEEYVGGGGEYGRPSNKNRYYVPLTSSRSYPNVSFTGWSEIKLRRGVRYRIPAMVGKAAEISLPDLAAGAYFIVIRYYNDHTAAQYGAYKLYFDNNNIGKLARTKKLKDDWTEDNFAFVLKKNKNHPGHVLKLIAETGIMPEIREIVFFKIAE